MRLAPVFLGSLARRRAATSFRSPRLSLSVALGMAVQAVHEAALAEFSRGLRSMTGGRTCRCSGHAADSARRSCRTGARPEVAAAGNRRSRSAARRARRIAATDRRRRLLTGAHDAGPAAASRRPFGPIRLPRRGQHLPQHRAKHRATPMPEK